MANTANTTKKKGNEELSDTQEQGKEESTPVAEISVMDFADISGMNSTDKGAVIKIYGTQKKLPDEWRQILSKDFILNTK